MERVTAQTAGREDKWSESAHKAGATAHSADKMTSRGMKRVTTQNAGREESPVMERVCVL